MCLRQPPPGPKQRGNGRQEQGQEDPAPGRKLHHALTDQGRDDRDDNEDHHHEGHHPRHAASGKTVPDDGDGNDTGRRRSEALQGAGRKHHLGIDCERRHNGGNGKNHQPGIERRLAPETV